MAINNAMLCRGGRTVDGGRVQAQKHSSGGHRPEGWGEKQKGSSISLSRHIFSVNGTKSCSKNLHFQHSPPRQ